MWTGKSSGEEQQIPRALPSVACRNDKGSFRVALIAAMEALRNPKTEISALRGGNAL